MDRFAPLEKELELMKSLSNTFATETREEIQGIKENSNSFAKNLAGRDGDVEARLDGLESTLEAKTAELQAEVVNLKSGSNAFAASARAALLEESSKGEARLFQVAQGQQEAMQRMQGNLEAKTRDAMQLVYDDLKSKLEAVVAGLSGVASAQKEQYQQQQASTGGGSSHDPLQTSADSWAIYNAGRVASGSPPLSGQPAQDTYPSSPSFPFAPPQSAEAAAAQAAATQQAAAAAAAQQQAAAAAAANAAAEAYRGAAAPRPGPCGLPPVTVAAIHPYRLSVKDWGSQAKLDLTRPTAYLNWYDQALDYLGPPSRPDVRALLKWAETQTVPIDAGREVIAVQELGAQGVHLAEGAAGVGFVSETILAGLRTIIHDNLLGRARAAGRGLELWRKLRSEARGSAPALAAVKAQQWSQPRQSASVAALWTDLDDWLLLGQEVEEGSLHSMVRPPWLKLQSLKMLLPSSLETQLKLQLPEANFDEALAWVRRQMEFQRGDSQAQSFAKNADKGLNEVRTELEAAKAREDELMWYLYEADAATIDAVRKGKGGKGGKKGRYGKNGFTQQQLQQRPPGKPGGPGGKGIKAKCWNCGEVGHMQPTAPRQAKAAGP